MCVCLHGGQQLDLRYRSCSLSAVAVYNEWQQEEVQHEPVGNDGEEVLCEEVLWLCSTCIHGVLLQRSSCVL